MLVIFGGLPATGKTTIARALAARIGAVYLRIDTIEQAMRDGLRFTGDMGPAGYEVAQAVAADNLRAGSAVVADSVNPIEITRRAWREVAVAASSPFLEIEVVCSDPSEHRRRVEMRVNDIPGLKLPTWGQVVGREYKTWRSANLILDTAVLSAAECVETALASVIAARRGTS